MLNIAAIQNDLIQTCKSFHVQSLSIFGSALTSEFGPDSDVDILVDFIGEDNLFDRYMELNERLEDLFGKHVDLVMSGAVKNPYFYESIESNKSELYAA